MTVDDIRNFGADTECGLKRVMGSADFYIRLVKMMPTDHNFQLLYDSIASNDLEKAFEACHALKGALGNLSLTALYQPIEELTEHLRARTQMDYTPYVEKIRQLHNELTELCSK